MKKIFLIAGILALTAIVLLGGFQLFAYSMFKSNSCTQFNIDNIELRTGINIPAVTNTDCENTKDTKHSVFTLDDEKVDIQNYLKRNNFTFEDGFYTKSGESKHTIWDAKFLPENNQLTVNLIYKDKRK